MTTITASGDADTYLQFHAADEFRVVTGGVERFEIANSLITSAVDINAPNFNSTSDIRYKTNIATVLDAIDKVKNLRGVTFDWIETGSKSMGVIAQEVEEIIPEVVVGEDMKSVNYSAIIGLLIEAMKEQQREIDEIKNLLIEEDLE